MAPSSDSPGRFQLRRHLTTYHGFSVDQYRARWNLPREHPMTAPTYSERLSGLAKQIGLGRGRRASREGPEPVTPEIPPQSDRGGGGGRDMGRRPRAESTIRISARHQDTPHYPQ